MRHVLLIILVSAATPAFGFVQLSGQCDVGSGEFQFNLTVLNQWAETDHEAYSIVLEQTLVGSCEKPVLAATPSLPLPPYHEEVVYVFAVPSPYPQRVFLYEAKLRHPDGTLEELGSFDGEYPRSL